MPRLIRAAALFATLLAALPAGAQESHPALQVRTFDLRNLRPQDAAKLVSPYVQSPGGGVYDAGSISAITVRETPQVLAVMDSLLRDHDRARATFVLRFQLIAALDSAVKDPRIEGIDAALRGLFRFAGYRLLAEGSTTAQEMQDFSLTMVGGAEQFRIDGNVWNLMRTGGDGSLRVGVALKDLGSAEKPHNPTLTELFSTGVTMPVGQSVVLGSAAQGQQLPALILVVQPTLAGGARR